MALRAVKPEILETPKPKFLFSGKPKVGKTTLAIQFPSVYYLDTEGGALRPQYRETLIKNGGMYFGKEQGSQDFKEVLKEIKELAITKDHGYKTLVIDSFSYLYNMAASVAEEKMGNDFGRHLAEANKPTRQLLRWLEAVDMTVILICHQKEKWEMVNGQRVAVGTTFDGFAKMEYILDLWIEAFKDDKDKRKFIVKASRVASMPENLVSELSYDNFASLYGQTIIERKSKAYEVATPVQITRVNELLAILKLPEGAVEKWLTKAGVDSFEDASSSAVKQFIEFCEKQFQPKEK